MSAAPSRLSDPEGRMDQAHRILVIDRQQIVEDGTFAELVGAGGLFSRLVAGQQLAG